LLCFSKLRVVPALSRDPYAGKPAWEKKANKHLAKNERRWLFVPVKAGTTDEL
jgi:hypothetical protein